MKRAILGSAATLVFFLCLATLSHATILTFEEAFLEEGANFRVTEGGRADFRFDLKNSNSNSNNNWAFLYDSYNRLQAKVGPTTDESGFDPALFDPALYQPLSGKLSFEIGGFDGGEQPNPPEKVKLRVLGPDFANTTLFNDWVSLGKMVFDFDLKPEWIANGLLRSLAIAPSNPNDNIINDFKIREVRLEVTAAPVPEPSTMLLLGAGIVGLVAYRRKTRQ